MCEDFGFKVVRPEKSGKFDWARSGLLNSDGELDIHELFRKIPELYNVNEVDIMQTFSFSPYNNAYAADPEISFTY
jgi:hypothetical protein